MFTTLIDAGTLASHLDDPQIAIVDCRFKLEDVDWGEREYAAAHVPGAVFANLDRDLSGPKTGTNGRHPLPEPAALAATLGRLGIDRDTQVVAYDQDVGMYAARLWWMLRWLGHDRVAVLDGGLAGWLAEGRPTTGGIEPREARVFVPSLRDEMRVDVHGVASRSPDWRLLDARAPERFRGEVETIDRMAGHIPGATNYFFKQSLNGEGSFLPPAELATRLRAALGDVPPERVVCYCGSGVTACHVLIALERAGLCGARLYPGSWSEWSSDPSRPIERGTPP